MIEMTLSSRHRIRNSSPGGLRPSTLPLGHGGSPQYLLSHVDGEETPVLQAVASFSRKIVARRLKHYYFFVGTDMDCH